MVLRAWVGVGQGQGEGSFPPEVRPNPKLTERSLDRGQKRVAGRGLDGQRPYGQRGQGNVRD